MFRRRQLVAGRSVKDGEGVVDAPSTHVFSGNSVVDRVLCKLRNKAERELQQLPELLRKARRAKSSDASRPIAVETSALEAALRPLLLPLVGGAARLVMHVLNSTSVRGAAAVRSAVARLSACRQRISHRHAL